MQAYLDQSYRPLSSVQLSERCTVNMFVPEQPNGDVVLWLHGGGLTQGDKGDAQPPIVVPAGCSLVSANYRLLHHAPYPACVQDAAAVLFQVPQLLERVQVSAQRVFIAGVSAGAYLAAMVTCDPRWLALHAVEAPEIAGAFLLSGQMTTHFAVKATNGDDAQRPMIDERAPLWHVGAGLAPMRCVVGSDDIPCRLEENELFVAALKAAGHKHQDMHVIAGRNHGTIGAGLGAVEDPVTQLLWEFINDPHCAQA